MKLLFDARAYNQKNGIGRYTTELLNNIYRLISAKGGQARSSSNNNQIDQLVLLASPDNQNSLEKFTCDTILVVPAQSRWYSWAEQFEIPRLINKLQPDLIHFPHLNAPLFTTKPFVITVHDLTMTKFPDPNASTLPSFLYWSKYWALRFLTWVNVHRAKKIITVSNFVKNDLLATYTLSENKISMIYEATEPTQILEVKRAYPVLLYVGATYPHKSVDDLITAAISLKKNFSTLQLWLVVPDDIFLASLKQKFAESEINNLCHFFHDIDNNFLNKLYQQAWVVVQPSHSEGFGFQLLEAWANKTAVACSDASSLPEIGGEAVALFPVNDISAIINVLKTLLTNEGERFSLVNLGAKRLNEFSWAKSAKQTLSIYINHAEKTSQINTTEKDSF